MVLLVWGNLKETESLEARIRWDENIKANLQNTVGGFGLD